MQIEEFLKKFHIFADLTPDEFVGVAKIFFQRRFARGDTLLREGDVSPQLILIEEGEVAVYRGLGKGGQALARRLPGESLGEFTVFGNDAHSATAIATTEVSAYIALGADFYKLVEQNAPGIGKIMVRLLGVAVGRFRKMEEKTSAAAASLSDTTIEERLMYAIQHNEKIRCSFFSGNSSSVEGVFRLVDVSSELGVPLVRLVVDMEVKSLHGHDIKVREYVIPMSGLHYLSFESSGKS